MIKTKKLLSALVAFCTVAAASSIQALDASYFSSMPKTDFTVEDRSTATPTLERHDFLSIPDPEPILLSEAEGKKLEEEAKGKKRSAAVLQKYDAYGELISPDTLFYRSLLSDNAKESYDIIYNALINYQREAVVSTYMTESIGTVVRSVCYDNPEIFWWWGEYNYCYYGGNYRISFYFLFNDKDLKRAVQDFNSQSFPVLFYASLLENDGEKMKYIHDYICQSARYNHAAVASGNSGGLNQSAYSTIVSYNTVCAGYAKAYAYYLQKLGIPSAYIHSTTHAWNLVKYNNNYYQTDTCWDDSDWGWDASYTYYLKSDNDMKVIDSHMPYDISQSVISKYRTKGGSYKTNFTWADRYRFEELKNFITDIEAPEYIHFGITKKVTRKTPSNIKLECSFNKKNGEPTTQVLPNQRVEIHVKPNKNCYVAVLFIDAKGNKTWLDTKDNFIKANTDKVFPDKHGYDIVVNGDLYGNERVIIYASSDEIGLPKTVDSQNFSEEDLHLIMKNLKKSLSHNPSATGQESLHYTVIEEK